MKRGPAAGLLAAAVVAVAGLLGPAAAVALAQPALPVAPAQTGASSGGLELRLVSLTPRIVTEAGPGNITVTGVLVNTGSGPVRDLVARVQRSDVLVTEAAVRAALAGDVSADAVTPTFTQLADELAPGAELPLSLSLPVRGSPDASLAVVRPGLYELLVNVNGVGADGVPARLAGGRMLLPVLDLPVVAGQPATGAAAPTATPTAASLLYPLADVPRRRPTGPGEPAVLTDDELAISLDGDGRLGGLLRGLERAPAGSPVRAGICLAVDPELLDTVQQMSQGYRVQAPDGALSEGRGAAAAGRWLEGLRAAARGTCVIALPMADTDLVALSRNGLADLGAFAVQRGSQIVAAILGTPVVAQATQPAEGLLDDRALLDYAVGGGRAVLLADNAVRTDRQAATGVVRLPAGAAPGQPTTPFAVLTDGLLTLSAGTDPGPALAAQDTIAALAFRAGPGSGGRGAAPTPLVLAPPHRWSLDGTEASALVGAFETLVGTGRFTAANLGAVLTAEPAATAPTGRLVYSAQAGASEVPATVTTAVRQARDSNADLLSAAENEPEVGASPGQVFEPVTEAMVAATSAAWRGRPELAEAAAQAVTARVEQLRSAVRVVEPPGPYALASEQAPLALTVANGLPVAMNVRVELTGTAGLRTAPIPLQRVPALGRLQLRVDTDVTRSGQFTVYATVSTPSGSPLGPPSRLLVNSTAYGTITLWLTGTAGALLVILVGRRVLRRIRRRPGPDPHPSPDLDPPPDPGPSPDRNPDRSPQPTSEARSPSPSGPAPPR